MDSKELRIGNYVTDKSGNIQIITPSLMVAIFEKVITFHKPILLDKGWSIKCHVEFKTIMGNSFQTRFIDNIGIPDYIESVHELQNWYYWYFNKTELTIN